MDVGVTVGVTVGVAFDVAVGVVVSVEFNVGGRYISTSQSGFGVLAACDDK